MAFKLWRGNYTSGTPDVSYENGKIWSGNYTSGTPDARYENGKVWTGNYTSGTPHARYENGKIWLVDYPNVHTNICTELINKLTEQEETPSSFETACSTRAAHAAQLIPVTLYCSIVPSSACIIPSAFGKTRQQKRQAV